ncbi:MAG: hypothetical protein JO258_07160 [Alphaproteobacteria bacterium]|nr:hypothetical protein [Alphaproteobacteria bacterium]
MKSVVLAAMVGVSAAGAALQPGNLLSLVESIYPLDQSKQLALQLCMLRDASFNRLAAAAREACYRHELTDPVVAAARATTRTPPNAIELRRADAWENAPGNDIRVIEASQGFTTSLADGPQR